MSKTQKIASRIQKNEKPKEQENQFSSQQWEKKNVMKEKKEKTKN